MNSTRSCQQSRNPSFVSLTTSGARTLLSPARHGSGPVDEGDRRLRHGSCGHRDRVHPAEESGQQLMIKIAGTEFDHHSYDEEADVLYLSVGQPQVPAETDATPEGHAVDYDADGNVIGMIIVNLRFLLERDRGLKITWPEAHVPREEFAAVLPAAA